MTIDANDLERMAKKHPDERFLKGSGVLKLTGAVRMLEGQMGVALALLNECVGPLEVSAALIEDEDGDEAIETLIERVKAFCAASYLSRNAGVQPPFERGSWQHAIDDQLVGFGKTSQEFATAHEAVQWLLEQTSEAAIACAGATVSIETLRQHWLRAMECDHATGQDKPHCSCSLVDLGWHPSIGAAVEAWLAHVAGVRACGSNGTVDCQSTAPEHRCATCPHGVMEARGKTDAPEGTVAAPPPARKEQP